MALSDLPARKAPRRDTRRGSRPGPGEKPWRGDLDRAARVLYVDDEADIREVVEIALGLDPAFEVRSCACGGDAVAAVAEWPPDIVLLDVIMPGLDGPATLARLRERRDTAEVPVVFLTARAESSERHRLLALGAAGVIAKPFDPMMLAALVRRYTPRAKNAHRESTNA
jgi:two-component system, OmpR family, response regulator